MRRVIFSLAGIAAVGFFTTVLVGQQPQPPATSGAYAAQCSSCHGAAMTGARDPGILAYIRYHTDAEATAQVRAKHRTLPLTDEVLRQVIADTRILAGTNPAMTLRPSSLGNTANNWIGRSAYTSDPYFANRSQRLAALAARHAVPAITQSRDFPAAGGLMSYGGDFEQSHRQAGVYAGRILKGEKPSELPVQLVTKVELFINLKAADALGVAFPPSLVGGADGVIE